MYDTTLDLDTTTNARAGITGCVVNSSVFQDQLLEEPLASSATADERRRYQQLINQAESICAACPLLSNCLYDAVTKHDVSGFVAGTTQRQRTEIRSRLRVTVRPEDFDTLAGVTGRHRQVDHEEVIRLRRANPHESLENLAARMGCSLSTVKRHLRKARAEGEPKVRRIGADDRPTPGQVLHAKDEITRMSRHRAA